MKDKDSLYAEDLDISQLNQAYLDISRVLIDYSSTIEEIAEVFLDKAKALTGSRFGFVNTIDPDTGVATSRTISRMMGKDCKTEGPDKRITFSPHNSGRYPSLWGSGLNEKKSFFTNSPGSHASSKGLPRGHIPIKNFLSVPVVSENTLIGQIALADSKTGFSKKDIDMIEKLTGLYNIAVRIKQVEQEKEAEKERFKLLVENMYEGLWQIDKDAVTVFVNRKMAKILGYTVEEMTGRSLFDFMGESERHIAERNMQRRKAGIKEEHDFRFIKKDGSTILARLETAPLFGKNGEFDGALSNVSDITEKRMMKERLIRSEHEKSVILNSMSEMLVYYDLEQNILWANKASGDSVNMKVEELVGKHCYEIWCASDRPCRDCPVVKARQTGKVCDARIKSPDGRIWQLRGYPIFDKSGAITNLMEFGRDITEHVKDEERLISSENKYRKLFETSPVGISIINKAGVITSCNDMMEEYVGIPKEKIQGKHFTKLGILKPGDIPRYIKVFADILRERITEPFEVSFYNRNGEERITEVYTSLLREDGKTTGVQLILRDITGEVRSEKELKLSYEQAKKTLEGTINTLSSILDIIDPYTGSHQRNTSKLCLAMAKELGLDQEKTRMLYTAALIHDIGKIAIPASILSRPSVLTGIEISMIHTHSQLGYDILKKIDFGYPLSEIVLQHHEKLDGSGYPKGLKGNDIMFDARILTVADTVEAMANHRPYRPSIGIEKALEEIRSGRGIFFDERAVDACLAVFKKKKFKFQ
jgi:PAS domain S-box-containing protein/putative nucleotidyltransferase with HDIG domain